MGLTVTAVPLVAVTELGVPVMTPVPLAKTAVSVVLMPRLMVGEAAAKLAMVGAGNTVMAAVAVTAVPVDGVTVRVYVVVAAGVTVTATPLLTVMLPGVMRPVPFENTAVRVALVPLVMLAALAAKLVMAAGGGGGVLDPPHPVKLARPRPARPRHNVMAQGATTKLRLMEFPV